MPTGSGTVSPNGCPQFDPSCAVECAAVDAMGCLTCSCPSKWTRFPLTTTVFFNWGLNSPLMPLKGILHYRSWHNGLGYRVPIGPKVSFKVQFYFNPTESQFTLNVYYFLAYRVRKSEFFAWDRNSYLTHVIWPKKKVFMWIRFALVV